jgi:hypothetical protein
LDFSVRAMPVRDITIRRREETDKEGARASSENGDRNARPNAGARVVRRRQERFSLSVS